MPIRDSGLLFDITTRLALFVEGVKLYQRQQFNTVLKDVDECLRKVLGRVNYKTLDGLSKAQLNRLLLDLRRSQYEIYSPYTSKLIKQLQDFMYAANDVRAIAYASAKYNFLNVPVDEEFTTDNFKQFGQDKAYSFILAQSELETFAPLFGLSAITPNSKTSLWSSVINAPIPANGVYMLPFIEAFARSAQATTENTIRRAWANKQTVEETLAELTGQRSVQGHSTQLSKIGNQASAVIDTAFAHVDQISSVAIASAIFKFYQWVSVIDKATSDTCRHLDGQVFIYGQGPVPPAHFKCRSTTVPLASKFDDFKAPTLYAWLKKQPLEIKREFLGRDAAALLHSGDITLKDFANSPIGKPISITQLKSKVDLILLT